MNSYYSILKYVNNPLSNETIALGLLVITNQEVYFHLSSQKMDLARKLNSKNYPLLEFSLKQFKNFVQKDTINESSLLIKSEKQINQELLFRLSNYNNGILQFSKPESINSTINSATFKEYFAKFIGEELMPEPKLDKSPFKNIIKKKLYDPLKDKIDVDFTLKKKQLETLFFDFQLDGIGVNGSIYAAKAIDFNSKRQLGQIRNDISDFESVIERLNIFAKSKGLSNHHQYCLIIDSYQGNSPSYLDLYSLLKRKQQPILFTNRKLHIFVYQ